MKQEPNQPARLAYTLEGFCEACSVTRTFAYSAIRDGRLRTFKAGRRRMVSGDAARDFLRSLETGDKAAA